MDDIKETVRNSGEKLCRAVTSLTTRLCDVSLTDKSDAHKAMDIVLPFLLAEGILSKVDSVRKASIGVVMKLTKVRNVLLCLSFTTYFIQSLCFFVFLTFFHPIVNFVYSHQLFLQKNSNLVGLYMFTCSSVYSGIYHKTI